MLHFCKEQGSHLNINGLVNHSHTARLVGVSRVYEREKSLKVMKEMAMASTLLYT